jgi:hypothetical protein
MGESMSPEVPPTDRETASGLLFALVAERLSSYYEHHAWPTLAQGATLVADWLGRSRRHLSHGQRKHLSRLSDQLARGIADSVSREAGLHITHEMMEALDERYSSATGQSMREECDRQLAADPLPESE